MHIIYEKLSIYQNVMAKRLQRWWKKIIAAKKAKKAAKKPKKK
jgi:hypothetical protein